MVNEVTMPGTTRALTNLDKPYEDGNPSSPTSFTSQDLRGAEGIHSSPNGSISSYSRTNSFDSLDDSNSSTGSISGSSHSRQISNDSSISGADYIPTRSIKQASKPQHNPLQFVKVGSCPMYKKATEQIKKYEEVKKLKTQKQDEEDWQHNLDNWKSKRRMSSTKNPEKYDELRAFEEEIPLKPRRKSKTFSQMVEQRSKRGRNFGYFSDEWDDSGDKNSWHDSESPKLDLSLDGSSTDYVFRDDESSDTSSVDRNIPEPIEPIESKAPETPHETNGNAVKEPELTPTNGCGDVGTNGSEEYTFDKAIQNYVQYAESQKKATNQEKKPINNHSQTLKETLDEVDSISTSNGTDQHSETSDNTNGSFAGERTGGAEMQITVKLKPGPERDFGFVTRGQGRGLVFVDVVNFRGSAEAAGLKVDDEILSINGEGVSNRSHSAIVFAIKQAVYTGHLELGIYRYNNAKQILKQGLNNSNAKKPSRIEERKAVFSRENSSDKEPSPEKRMLREKSPKVDVLKRRSMFESPPKEIDVHQPQRRSMDAGSSMKTKISSFENLDTIEKSVPKSPEENGLVLKQKPLVHPDKKNGKSSKLDFKKKLASFENLESVGKNSEIKPMSSERKQRLKERLASFEKSEPVIRSVSCDFLDVNRQNDHVRVSRQNSNNSFPDYQECDELDGKDEVDTNCYPRIIDVLSKEDSPEVENMTLEKLDREEFAVQCKENSTVHAEPQSAISVHEESREEVAAPVIEVIERTILMPSNEAEALQLKRADSTKRIKKELRRLRSDFLGFDAPNEQILDNSTVPNLISAPAKRPERIDDSKVQVIKKKSTEQKSKQDLPPLDNCTNHIDISTSKYDSVNNLPAANDVSTKVDDEEDDLARKEQEIIENLEREEQQKKMSTSQEPILNGYEEPSKIKEPLKNDIKENGIIQVNGPIQVDPVQEDPEILQAKIAMREQELRRQEEQLARDRERLRQQQEELEKQREEYLREVEQYKQAALTPKVQPALNGGAEIIAINGKDSAHADSPGHTSQSDVKPSFVKVEPKLTPNTLSSSPEELYRNNIKSTQPSGLEMHLNSPKGENISRNQCQSSTNNQSRLPLNPEIQTANSAKNKLSNSEKCIARRKQEPNQKDPSSYNQHWLIQEAEMRRINEQNDRLRQPRLPATADPMKDNVQRPMISPNTCNKTRRQSQQNAQKELGIRANSLQGLKTPMGLKNDHSRGRSPEKKDYVEIATLTPQPPPKASNLVNGNGSGESQMLSVSGKKKCSHCGEELGKGAAMIIESLQLFYHIQCFKCCVCHVQLGNGLSGADVRVRSHKLHCHNCYSNDEAGLKFSKV